ncbi:putative glycosyl hydrolase-like family 15 (GHL15) protein [Mariniflexile fucanivorans]|uniref:Putative glycosyl hydrolase-like family 15 (GHL15) protein n=1 Tax=Mariniflexile fucanivorans TaxID=264023 RepID=A0A4R1RNK1_9FLAO|nr:putative glycoside hydrolase [Mariniflexile fucanivorans]TCL67895.1 putative glycosyl hydrolase-like family 15 (GHL15) protein [Mariniflexile fucanivorans]
MKIKLLIITILVSLISISNVISQTFNKNTDLLLANFDLKPDEDDVMAAAGLACMLKHPDLEGINYYAVAGAYGKQDKFEYITIAVPDFYNVLFGAENEKWTDAHTNWDASVKRTNTKVIAVLNAGGKVFVQEAGQSDFTHDVLKAAIADGITLSTINQNVIVVQHSKWNENQTRTPKLDWVKNNTVYQKIADGNTCCNGTPEYKTSETKWLNMAKSSENKNAEARKFWAMADEICKKWESSWTNKTIAAGGLDFSDTVEIWQIFNIGDKANDIASFWNRYVIDGKTSNEEKSPIYENSDGSSFVPKDFYPKFSWETTPLYFMFGDKERVLHPEEVKFIAERTDFVCIEKSHGYDELGAAELGAKHDATAFKSIKPDMKVLFYFNAALAWPFTSYSKDFTNENIDSAPKLKEFLIKNPNTGALAQKHTAFLFNILNPDFRAWWVETVAKGVRESGCDGVFIDQMHGNANLMEDKKVEIELAMGEMMTNLKKQLGDDTILLANNANDNNAKYVYPVSDALMFENYSAVHYNKENLLSDWNNMLRNAKAGKISVFRLGVEGHDRGFLRNISNEEKHQVMPKISQEKLEYALACYLIGAQPYSYFMYSWGWALADGALVDYPELQKPLGAPKGSYKRTTPNGWEFTREFEHASVWINTESREAKIKWR